jgi:signal transduction histidine kinase
MNLRAFLLAIVAGVALLGAAWQLVVPALLSFEPGQVPELANTLACAGGALAIGVMWIAVRRRGFGRQARPPTGLPAELALVIALAGSGMGALVFALVDLPAALRLDAAVAAAGFACGLGPAAGATLATLDIASVKPGRGGSLPQLAAGTVVLTAIAGWCLLGPVVTRQALPSTRPTFETTVALLSLAAIFSAWFLSWMLGRLLGRDLESATLAVRWLDAPGQTGEHALAAPARPGSDLAELAAAAERLRARLAEEVSAYEGALARSRHADEAREEFLRVVSHELRTPLNAICGYAQLLLEGIEGPLGKEAADSVQSVLDSGRQLSALVDDVVDLAMLSSGRPGLKLAPVDAGQLLREIARAHAPLLHGRPLELRLELADNLPRVLADRKRVRQVLTNLLANAIKFTDEGFVRCVIRRADDDGPASIEVEVADTGVGIAPHELAGIFDEYRQGSNTGSRRQKGAGLGLAICRRLVELHGGAIRAESREGEGARFVLTLPVDGPHVRKEGRP